jgi:YbbR domain-containing protein
MKFCLARMGMSKMSKVFNVSKKLKETKYLLKVVSIFLSLFLWFFVLKSQPVSIEETLYVQYDLPNGYTFAKAPKEKVTVYLEGLRATLRRSDIEKSKIRVNIPNINKNRFNYTAEIASTSITQPTGVKIKDYHPKKIQLVLEKMVTKKIPIRVEFKEKLSRGISLNSHSTSPSEVKVSGPVSLMKNISELTTTQLDLSRLALDDSEHQVQLNIPKLMHVNELETTNVTVLLNLDAVKPVSKELEIPIKFITNGNSSFRSSHQVVKVIVKYIKDSSAGTTEMNDLNYFGINVFADLTTHQNNDKKGILLNIEKPKHIKIMSLNPDIIFIDW